MHGFQKRRRRKWLLIATAVLVLFIALFLWVDRALQPALRHAATIRLQQLATEAINQAVLRQVASTDRFSNLMEWKIDTNGKVYGAMFNQKAHAEMTATCIRVVEQALTSLKKFPEHIPLGKMFDSPLLAQLGPRIRITLEPAGIVTAQMGSSWKEAGINTMMLEIYVDVSTDVRALFGFDAVRERISTRIPLTYAVFNGEVPQYYMKQEARPPTSVPDRPNVPSVIPSLPQP